MRDDCVSPENGGSVFLSGVGNCIQVRHNQPNLTSTFTGSLFTNGRFHGAENHHFITDFHYSRMQVSCDPHKGDRSSSWCVNVRI